jgi:NAD-dependent dihydropyrimidine dehydrogenase PreA subunit
MAFGPSQENAIMSPEKKTWHGIPREDVPWLPTVDPDSCIGCQLCYVTCGRGVYEMREGVAVAVEAMECVVGCSTCGNVCPTAAISFPKLDMVWKLERERQVFRTVKKEALSKHDREAALQARDASMSTAQPVVPTRAKVEVTSERQEAVAPFLDRVTALVREVGLVLVAATPVA